MVGNVTIQGQIVGTATFDGAKISAVVTIAPPINATVNFGGGISTIEQLPDPISDSSNIYGWIRSALLTGLSEFTHVTIAATDTILQGFAKLQGQINALKSRLGLLENNVILDVTLAVDTVNVTLTLPDTEESVLLEYGSAAGMNNNDGVNSGLQINGVTTTSYVTNGLRYNRVLLYTGRHAFFGTLEIMRINGYLFFVNTAQQIWGNTSTQTISGRFMQGYLEIAQPGVNSITIFGNYKAGTRFKLLRKK